ncbi:MAG: alpha-N-arabinofuranosidase [Saprospiraceae bacterium]|nr:alpha-N-arabinofuranosidase [Saprospiraceae bacterium]
MKYTQWLCLLWVLICCPIAAQVDTVRIAINADQGIDTINRHIYGHFAEHLGRCIYGGFYVGEDNQVIANTDGVRNDIVDALKALKIPNLRWPGGCFADTYHWKDGIGPKSQRPTIVNRWWGGTTEDNSFGTHDFLNLCEILDTEPYLSANVGSGTVQELIDWVQYTNHGGRSPMADVRRSNGRDEPWGVTYWGVGNETWGCGGNMTVEYYANIYRQYATFMPGWSSGKEIVRIASGASSSDYHWTEVLMRDVPHKLMEAVALHHYSVIDWSNKGPDINFSDDQYFTIIENALHMEELITRHSTIMDKYDPEKKVALFVDEWGAWYDGEENKGVLYQQNTMRDAMVAGSTLNIFNNHADRVKMANIAQTVNVLQAVVLTDEEKMILTPTYHVMQMYAVHQHALQLPIHIDNTNYEHNGHSLPAVNVSASTDREGKTHISIVNIDLEQSRPLVIHIGGEELGDGSANILQSENINDHNSFDQPNRIHPRDFTEFVISEDQIELTIPPFSLVVLEL